MNFIHKAFGIASTNCYILRLEEGEIIIDPGDGAYDWICLNCKNPLAVLNTHGHFDHVFDDSKLREKFKIKIYIPKDDAFMLQNDQFGQLKDTCNADILVGHDEEITISKAKFKFHHFPGHTPGCSMIEYEDLMFSGDFLFKNSIGRYDFVCSNRDDMVKSLIKVQAIKKDFKLLPGHGFFSTLKAEQNNIAYWLSVI